MKFRHTRNITGNINQSRKLLIYQIHTVGASYHQEYWIPAEGGNVNTIAVRPMQTPYGYEEQHLMIDGVFLPYYVEAYAKASEEGYFKGSGSLLVY